MDKRTVPELMKFVIDNAQAPDLQASLKDVKRDTDAFARTVESATNTLEYFQTKMKKIITEGSQAGFFQQEIVANKADAENILNALLAKNAQMGAGREWQYNIEMQAAPIVQGTMTLIGKEARKLAQAEAQRLGGDVWDAPTKKNPDRVKYFFQSDAAEELTGAQKTSIFKGARKVSREAEIDRILDEQNKAEKQRRDEHDKEQKAIQKEQLTSRAKRLTVTKNIAGLLVLAVDLLRRLAINSLKRASDVNMNTTEANSIGVAYTTARRFGYFEAAHGLPAGTSMGAMKDLQHMFGDITNLDEKALETLARVMGGDITALVTSGMGGQEPDKLLETILDKYFEQFKQGKNSLGQIVGQNQAARELVTSLEGVSGELAKLFAKMTSDYMSGSYGSFGSAEEWFSTTQTNRGGITSLEAAYNAEIGKKYDEVLGMFEQMKQDFFLKLGNQLGGILDTIKNIRVGMSGKESLELDAENRIKNIAAKEDFQGDISTYEGLIGGSKAWQSIKGSTGGLTIKDVAYIGAGLRGKDFYGKSRFSKGQKVFDELLGNPETMATVAGLVFSLRYLNETIDPELAKREGGADVSLSSVAKQQGVVATLKELIPNPSDFISSLLGEENPMIEQEALFRFLTTPGNEDVLDTVLSKLSGETTMASSDTMARADEVIRALRDKSGINAQLAHAKNNSEKARIIASSAFDWRYKNREVYERAAYEDLLNNLGSETAIIDLLSNALETKGLLSDGTGSWSAVKSAGGFTITINMHDDQGRTASTSFDIVDYLGREGSGIFNVEDNQLIYTNAR